MCDLCNPNILKCNAFGNYNETFAESIISCENSSMLNTKKVFFLISLLIHFIKHQLIGPKLIRSFDVVPVRIQNKRF